MAYSLCGKPLQQGCKWQGIASKTASLPRRRGRRERKIDCYTSIASPTFGTFTV